MLDGAQRSICFLLLKATKSGSPAPLGMTTSGLGPPRRLASRAIYGRRVSSAQPSMYLAGLRSVQSSWRLPRPDGVSGEAGATQPDAQQAHCLKMSILSIMDKGGWYASRLSHRCQAASCGSTRRRTARTRCDPSPEAGRSSASLPAGVRPFARPERGGVPAVLRPGRSQGGRPRPDRKQAGQTAQR